MKKFTLYLILVILWVGSTAATPVIFIDPDYSGQGKGTIEAPFSKINTVQSNVIYLFRSGTVYRGSFTIGSVWGVTFSHYDVGPKPVILVPAGAEGFRFNSFASDILIQGLDITGENNAAGPLIHFRGYGTGNTIKGCDIHGGTYCIRAMSLLSPPNDYNSGLTLVNNIIYNSKDDAVYLYKIHGLNLYSNVIYNVNMYWKPHTTSQKTAAGDGCQLNLCDRIRVEGNIIDRSATGNKFCIIFTGTAGSNGTPPVQDNYIVINNNKFVLPLRTSEGGAGLYFGDLPAQTVVEFTFNEVRGEMCGIKYTTLGTFYSNGNTFYNLSFGIELQRTQAKGVSTSDAFAGMDRRRWATANVDIN